jgi:hypothetical protein
MSNEVGDASKEIDAVKKELMQMKQSHIKAKVHKKEDAVSNAESKICVDTELEYSRNDCKSTAFGIDEATFLKCVILQARFKT